MPIPLPIDSLAPAIAAATAARRMVIEAPTGSGKSTRVPVMLRDLCKPGAQRVVVLEPRRIAARMLAARVADETGGSLGREVGYQIRFENRSAAETSILFVTEGVLLRRMLDDPDLKGIGALVFDEFHERHLFSDITLARALDLQESRRPDLILAVMSATLDSGALQKYLAPCETIRSEGRTHPVSIEYLQRLPDMEVWDLAARKLAATAAEGRLGEGHALVFMPGGYEIERTLGALRAEKALSDRRFFGLHGEMTSERQDEAVGESDVPKVIVATNVAETSLTIPGVTTVVDSGLARMAAFDPHRGINTLLVEKISRAAADQRAGRAGRTAPGLALRLWTEEDHRARRLREEPEIRRVDLAETVLLLKNGGVEDVAGFRWLDMPDPAALQRALALLADLGALDPVDGRLTSLGRRLLHFPAHPRYGRMFVEAERLGCRTAVALAAAFTQARPILVRKVDRSTAQRREDLLEAGAESDFEVLFRAFTHARRVGFNPARCGELGIHAGAARQAAQIAEQFGRIAGREAGETANEEPRPENLSKCLLAGFSDHLAVRRDEGTLRCDLSGGRRGEIVKESVVRKSPLVVAAEVREVDGRDRLNVLLSLVAGVRKEWLEELFLGAVTRRREAFFDSGLRRVVARQDLFFRDLAIERGRMEEPTTDEAAVVLAAEVARGGVTLTGWDKGVEDWLARLNWAAQALPDLELPALPKEAQHDLLAQICHGARSERELKNAPVRETVQAWLNHAQRTLLDKAAPDKIQLPSGRRAKVDYESPSAPVVSALIQDLFGLEHDLRVGLGRIPVTLEILAPNRRPVQVTTSLESFWKNTYPGLRVELKRRYPRHEWR